MNRLVDENNAITVATLSIDVENLIGNNLQKSIHGTFPAVDPDTTNKNIYKCTKNNRRSLYFYNNQTNIISISKSKTSV